MKALTIKEIPDEVIQKFKAWCAMNGFTMAQAVIAYMKEQGEKVKLSK